MWPLELNPFGRHYPLSLQLNSDGMPMTSRNQDRISWGHDIHRILVRGGRAFRQAYLVWPDAVQSSVMLRVLGDDQAAVADVKGRLVPLEIRTLRLPGPGPPLVAEDGAKHVLKHQSHSLSGRPKLGTPDCLIYYAVYLLG
jgi:hypothetical protein